MLTDFNRENLYRLGMRNATFLLQCPRTKIVHRMKICNVTIDDTFKYYISTINPYLIGVNCLYVRLDNNTTGCFKPKQLSEMLKTKNFFGALNEIYEQIALKIAQNYENLYVTFEKVS